MAPDYLTMRPAGLDIADQSVKFCSLIRRGRVFRAVAIGERLLPEGAVVAGRVRDAAALSAALAALRSQLGTSFVAAALPEEPSYTFTLTLPRLLPGELRQSIELQLEEHVPLPPEGVVFDYEIIRSASTADQSCEVAVSVFPRSAALEYLGVLRAGGLEPVAFELEAQASARALLPGSREVVLGVDIGRTHTRLFVVAEGRVIRTSTIAEIGAALLTRTVEKSLSLDPAAAEKLKLSRGLLESGDKALFFALLPPVSVLRDEIARFLTHWNTEVAKAGSGKRPVERLVLAGGEAALPGLAEHLNANLGVPVAVGNPWAVLAGSAAPPLPSGDLPKYATVIGLALRSFIPNHD